MSQCHADSDVVVAAIVVIAFLLNAVLCEDFVSSHYCIWLLGKFFSLGSSGPGGFSFSVSSWIGHLVCFLEEK